MSCLEFVKKILTDDIAILTTDATIAVPSKCSSSISHFSVDDPIIVGNLMIAKTKGCGQGGRPPKHLERFISISRRV